MFVNKETGAPAWLIAQDTDVVYCTEPPSARGRNHIVTSPCEFFSAYREATRDELDEIAPLKGSETIVLKPVAKKKTAARKPPKAAAKPAGEAKPPAPGRGPHGEEGRD